MIILTSAHVGIPISSASSVVISFAFSIAFDFGVSVVVSFLAIGPIVSILNIGFHGRRVEYIYLNREILWCYVIDVAIAAQFY